VPQPGIGDAEHLIGVDEHDPRASWLPARRVQRSAEARLRRIDRRAIDPPHRRAGPSHPAREGVEKGRFADARDAVDERYPRPVRVEHTLKGRELALPPPQRDAIAHRDKLATSDARGLREPTGDTGGPVEDAEATDRDVHQTGCGADRREQVRREIVIDGLLGLERVHAAEDPFGTVGEPHLRGESWDRGEGRSELLARAHEFLLGESIKVEVHDQNLHGDLLARAGGPHDDDDVPGAACMRSR